MNAKLSDYKISRLWWVPLVTGLISLGLGVWTILCPAESLPILAYTFAACLIAAGVLNVGYAFIGSGLPNWGWSLVLGILEFVAGAWLFSLSAPAATSAFIFIMGIWLLVAAINSIGEASMLSVVSGWGMVWMIFLLICTMALVVIFLSAPIQGGIVVWLWLGISLITFGIFRISLSFSLRKLPF